MAKKISLNKLNLKKEEKVSTLTIGDIELEVKQYLPIREKLALVVEVLVNSVDGTNNFANPIRTEMYADLAIIEHYTNLSFTDKQKEEADKTFDLLETNNIIDAIVNMIPEDEYEFLLDAIEDTIDAYFKYTNSVLGILNNVKEEYNDLDLDATKIQEKLQDAESLGLLKEVLTKLG